MLKEKGIGRTKPKFPLTALSAKRSLIFARQCLEIQILSRHFKGFIIDKAFTCFSGHRKTDRA